MKDRIKQLCKMKGVSMNQAEKDCQLSSGYLSKLDKSTPSADNVQILADYFGVSIDYLMNGDDAEQITETAKSEYRLLFDACSRVKPSDVATVLKILSAFTED